MLTGEKRFPAYESPSNAILNRLLTRAINSRRLQGVIELTINDLDTAITAQGILFFILFYFI